jgi:hypothetical protein
LKYKFINFYIRIWENYLVGLTFCTVASAGVYLMSDTSGLSHGPYLGTTTFCSMASMLILIIKASVYSPVQDIGPDLSPSLADHKLNLKKLWGMPVLFLSSLVFALGHVIVAYKTSCQARRMLLIHRIYPESVWLSCTCSLSLTSCCTVRTQLGYLFFLCALMQAWCIF